MVLSFHEGNRVHTVSYRKKKSYMQAKLQVQSKSEVVA
jgi:hypothetical protein